MSLILDALRKSEAERRRGEAPGLFTPLPTPGARSLQTRSNGPWIGAGIFVLIAVAAVAWWYRTPATLAPVVVMQTPAPIPAPAPAAVIAAPAEPAPLLVAIVPPPNQIKPHEQKSPPIAALPSLPEPPAAPKPAVVESPIEALPTLAMLDPSERAGLPPLKLSMHVWSEAPNARLAIIDGQRVMEGSSIGESIVAEIRRDGVVLNLHGRRFLLARP
jgi:general secretion pathway protein B